MLHNSRWFDLGVDPSRRPDGPFFLLGVIASVSARGGGERRGGGLARRAQGSWSPAGLAASRTGSRLASGSSLKGPGAITRGASGGHVSSVSPCSSWDDGPLPKDLVDEGIPCKPCYLLVCAGRGEREGEKRRWSSLGKGVEMRACRLSRQDTWRHVLQCIPVGKAQCNENMHMASEREEMGLHRVFQ